MNTITLRILPRLCLWSAAIFIQPATMQSVGATEAPLKKDIRADEFCARAGVEPITIGKDSKIGRDVSNRWVAWLEKSVLGDCRNRVKARYPDHAAKVSDLLTRATSLKFTHPDFPVSVPGRDEFELGKLAEEVIQSKIDDPVVAWACVLARAPRSDYEVENQRILDAAEKSAETALLRYLIAAQRFGKKPRGERAAMLGRAARAVLADGATFRPEDEDVLVPLFLPLMSSMPEEAADELADAPRWSEWARFTLEGRCETEKAWRARGSGWASTVTSQGWMGFEKHLNLARAALTRAWRLRPDQPYAATAMITVTMGAGDQGDGTLRDWFDRAVAAQFDYLPAYSAYQYAQMPRWGGSHTKMLAFGLACAQTRRFDTRVPGYLLTTLEKVADDGGEWRPLFSSEPFRSALMEVGEGYLREESDTHDKHNNLSMLALIAFLCGDYNRAAKEFHELKYLSYVAQGWASKFGFSDSVIRQEIALFQHGALETFRTAQRLYERGDLGASRSAFEKVIAAMPPKAIPVAAEHLAAIDFEAELTNGDWVRLKVTPKLEGWQRNFGFRGTEDGVLEAPRDAYGITKLGRTGANVELRGEFTLHEGKAPARGLAININQRLSTGPSNPIGCGVYIGEDGKTVIASLTDARRPTGDAVELGAMLEKFLFHITLREGKLSFELNGKKIFDSVVPTYVGSKKPLPVDQDGVVGFAVVTAGAPTDGLVRILWAEVRKLNSAPAPSKQ